MPEYITKEQAYLCMLEHWDGDMLPGDYDDYLREIPPADVEEVVHARWIEDEYAYATCSHCGYEAEYPEEKTPYCPQCGARMEGDQR